MSKGLIIAAAASGSGKTTISLGLLRALLKAGHKVKAAKAGPDYIDPQFHSAASRAASLNLDAWGMRSDYLEFHLQRHMLDGELLLIEGVMGLFDGSGDLTTSTAELARRLRLPVVVVLDVSSQAQTAAALALGLARFDPDVEIVGVILNRVKSERHLSLTVQGFEQIDLPVLGVFFESEAFKRPSRHLGLVQALEVPALEDFLETAADYVSRNIDLRAITELARPLGLPACMSAVQGLIQDIFPYQRIAIACDEAFSFIYPHFLKDLRREGREIHFFSPLADESPPPEADMIYLPGGYPELHLETLQKASCFRKNTQKAAQNGTHIYGECGGYMTLGKSITGGDGRVYDMLDLLPIMTSFERPALQLGYRHVRSALSEGSGARSFKAHEFHYATTLCEARDDASPLWRDVNTKQLHGLCIKNVSGSFLHLIDIS